MTSKRAQEDAERATIQRQEDEDFLEAQCLCLIALESEFDALREVTRNQISAEEDALKQKQEREAAELQRRHSGQITLFERSIESTHDEMDPAIRP
jgi:hypothetical protein